LWWCRTTRVNQINKLIWYFEIEDKKEAIILEKKIKSSGHIER